MYQLTQIRQAIFLITFMDSYELAMHFLRAQEFYESPNPDFKDSQFKLLDYIDWYSKEHDGVFSYAKDWIGFNVPGTVLNKLYNPAKTTIPDENDRDRFMAHLHALLTSISQGPHYYLLGTVKKDLGTLKHEMAHALYHTDATYREEQIDHIISMQGDIENKLKNVLHSEGYDWEVIDDELQAYLGTGASDEVIKAVGRKEWNKIAKPFEKTFKKYYK